MSKQEHAICLSLDRDILYKKKTHCTKNDAWPLEAADDARALASGLWVALERCHRNAIKTGKKRRRRVLGSKQTQEKCGKVENEKMVLNVSVLAEKEESVEGSEVLLDARAQAL